MFAKTITVLISILVVFLGRWYHLNTISTIHFIDSMLYGINTGIIAYFLFDLVLAKGLLQQKIKYIKFSLFYLILIIIMNSITYKMMILSTELTIVLLISIIFIILDKRNNKTFLIDHHTQLPQKYIQKHFLTTIFETLFRLFPNPVPIGFYKLGTPTDTSPFYVTGNYDLTVRRVVHTLKDMDCFLLVCDSRGINIWCSSLANHFNTKSIIDSIKHFKLNEKVKNKHLILPQLMAGNINRDELYQETSFHSSFGPVDIKDIEFKQNQTNKIRLVKFPLMNRIEMALGSPIILISLLILIYNFFNIKELLIIIPIIYGLSIIHSLIFPYRPIKNIIIWSILSSILLFLILYFIPILSFHLKLTLSISYLYLINEFSGWSPLIKYNLIPYHKPTISINENCIGCKTCVQVCPKGVFEIQNGKAIITDQNQCILCKACFTQCQAHAINHSMNEKEL